jgi:hypothetical protein
MKRGSKSAVANVAAAALTIGAVVGAVALTLGLQHNVQGEFIDTATGRIDVVYCALVFGFWFLLASVTVAAVAGFGYSMAKLLRRIY